VNFTHCCHSFVLVVVLHDLLVLLELKGSSLDLRVLVTALLASNIPMLEHSSVGNGASSTPGTNVSIARVRVNAPRLVDAFCVYHDASCLSCSLLRGKSREHGISVHHGDDVCGFRSL
jgi:hypothetical protein